MTRKGADDINDTLCKEGPEGVRRRHDRARKHKPKTNGHEPPETQPPVIRLRSGSLHEIASEAEAALIASGAPIYARGGELVRPIIEEVAALKGRRTKVARLKPITVDMLRDHLSRAARWERFSSRARKFVMADPPVDVANPTCATWGRFSRFSLRRRESDQWVSRRAERI